ncbi:hypothetical protein A4G99_07090 [Haladaptatus sp. R4]|uniref:HVO_A0114 family putative DNA-binding protein n=1 Tax=Haladaptatus sp. R4 TaxID=1679489 RepID=UPI0007B48A71|nr:hypothetical protein [Haladaptatus sp. R4]KZN24200.1 hypothetical protein A4G99_07090 [Haladaptatus sp. R4]
MTESKTLYVRVGAAEQLFEETKDAIETLERGEPVAKPYVLHLEDESDLGWLVSGPTLELMRTISRDEPKNVRELANTLGRKYESVRNDIAELETLRVVECDDVDGEQRPHVRFDSIEIDIPVSPDAQNSSSVVV